MKKISGIDIKEVINCMDWAECDYLKYNQSREICRKVVAEAAVKETLRQIGNFIEDLIDVE